MAASASHSEATLALAKKESAEHLHGMKGLYDDMRKRPLIVKAYALDDANAPADAKIVHFVRHGQGFHNLMADIASSQGREWVQVGCRLAFVMSNLSRNGVSYLTDLESYLHWNHIVLAYT